MPNTIMHTLRHRLSLGRGVEVEDTSIAPILHNCKSIEQWHPTLPGHQAHVVVVDVERHDRLGSWAVLHVHQDYIGAGILQRLDSFIEDAAKRLGFNAAYGV